MELVEDYQNTIADQYHADVEQVDFSSPHTAAYHINDWINSTTQGSIPSIVEEGNNLPNKARRTFPENSNPDS